MERSYHCRVMRPDAYAGYSKCGLLPGFTRLQAPNTNPSYGREPMRGRLGAVQIATLPHSFCNPPRNCGGVSPTPL